MSKQWKVIVLLIGVMSLIGPIICVVQPRADTEAGIQRLIQEELHRREMKIVLKYREKLNVVRKEMGMPEVRVDSLEDLISAFAGGLTGIESTPLE